MRGLGILSLAIVLVSTTLLVLSPVGYRMGWWGVPMALQGMLKWAVFLGLASLVLSLIVILATWGAAGAKPAWIALVLSFLIVVFPIYQFTKVRSLPMIHDITTDTQNPPVFIALAESRLSSPNGLEYKASENAEAQKKAYPDIVSFESNLPPTELFAKAEAAARALNLDIVSADATEGRIEAVATTLFFGFKDDVVFRIQPIEAGSRLDIRSMSRVGKSDIGANANRIRRLLAALR